MKQMAIKISSADESVIIQKSVFTSGGKHQDGSTKIKKTDYQFLFISDTGDIIFSNDILSFEKRIDFEISVYDAVKYLSGLIEKQPFLNREGIRGKLPYSIDAGVKNAYISMCDDQGYNKEKRLENLIAADVKMRILGKDTLSILQGVVNHEN